VAAIKAAAPHPDLPAGVKDEAAKLVTAVAQALLGGCGTAPQGPLNRGSAHGTFAEEAYMLCMLELPSGIGGEATATWVLLQAVVALALCLHWIGKLDH